VPYAYAFHFQEGRCPDLSGVVTAEEARELAEIPGLERVQFRQPVDPASWPVLERELFSKRPDVALRVFGNVDGDAPVSLAFLHDVPSVRSFWFDGVRGVSDLESLGALPRLETLRFSVESLTDFRFLESVATSLTRLHVGWTRSRRPSLAPIARFRRLTHLSVGGHRRGFGALAELGALVELRLSRMKDPGFTALTGLPNLRRLEIDLGGAKDLSGVARLAQIRRLGLCWIRGLTDLSFLSGMTNLEVLELDRLTAPELPDLSRLTRLGRLEVAGLTRLESWDAIATAPALTVLTGSHAGLSVEAVARALAAPKLRRASVFFEAERDERAFAALAAARGIATG
jgi:hypothetical protein